MKKLKYITLYFICLPHKIIRRLLIDYFHYLGFSNIYRSTIHGPKDRVHRGKNVGYGNGVFFNTRSGSIFIGDETVLSFNCMFLTGIHMFENGKLKERKQQVPDKGYDIKIGKGCWIASNAIVIGGVEIGENCIIAAGAVVTKSFPAGCVIGGVPAKKIGNTIDLSYNS